MTRQWTIRFPAHEHLMSANRGSSPISVPGMKRPITTGSSYRKRLRAIMFDQLRIRGLPKGLAKARVDVILSFPRNARRDTANYHPYVAKPIVDALGQPRHYLVKGRPVVEPGYGMLLGDDPAHLHCTDCPHISFDKPCGVDPYAPHGWITVVITDVSEHHEQPVLFTG